MSTYNLSVHGETVHIEFRRINDSRRIDKYYTRKAPNLFLIKGAMRCRVTMPATLAPGWYQEKFSDQEYHTTGISLCFRKDTWNSRKGRHACLVDALNYPGCDEALNTEITEAFTAAEAERMPKPKPPRFTPKTRKPRLGLRATLARMCELLEQLAHPPYVVAAGHPFDLEEFNREVQKTLAHVANHPPFIDVRPADTDMEPMTPGIAPMNDTTETA